ncbi:MAG TPA: hypothetical protein VF331_27890 [Polyangiales bacterium]
MSNAQRMWRLSTGAIAALFAATHTAAVFTENINWDEFAALDRVATMLRTHQLQGGGRPGAVELVLAPFVSGCRDVIATIQHARLLWVAATLSGLVALYQLMCRMRAQREQPTRGAVLAVALLALALPFLRWSVQVRTDQLSVVCGLWAGVALLGSRKRAVLALLAGFGLGAGVLFTQKLVYVAGLCALLALADVWVEGASAWRRERGALGLRALLCTLGISLVVGAFWWLLPHMIALPRAIPINYPSHVSAHYQRAFGGNMYGALLAALVPHCALVVALAAATLRAVLRRQGLRRLVVSWVLLCAGLAVAVVHVNLFPYFWMTLGLFPAAALGYAVEEISEVIPVRVRSLAALGLAAALLLPAGIYSVMLLDDTQRVQRDVLHFAQRHFDAHHSGFQLEGALACRADPDPFPVYFREHIERLFSGPEAAANSAALIERFRTKPVYFLIASHMIPFFSEPVQQFWQQNYQPRWGPLYVVGRHIVGSADGSIERWDVFAAGRYRFEALDPHDGSALRVDGQTLVHGQALQLSRGEHRLELRAPGEGSLVLAVDDAALPPQETFYSIGPIVEIIGHGYFPK